MRTLIATIVLALSSLPALAFQEGQCVFPKTDMNPKTYYLTPVKDLAVYNDANSKTPAFFIDSPKDLTTFRAGKTKNGRVEILSAGYTAGWVAVRHLVAQNDLNCE